MSVLLFAAFGPMVAIFQGVQNILIPAAVQRLAPDTKLSTLALLTTLSAVTTIAAFLVGGMLSDRTRTRFGRRTPWLVGMSAASILTMLAMGLANSVAALLVLMPLLWFTANFYQTVLLAILPDRIPAATRGFASAAMALGVPIGILVGVNVAAMSSSPLLGYVLLTIPHGLATAALALLDREPSSVGLAAKTATAGPSIGTFFEAFRHRDFTLAFVSRFLLFLSFYQASCYLFFILQDYVGIDVLPGRSPAQAISLVLSLKTIAWLVVTPFTGAIADRIGHTAGVVGWTSIAIGLVMLIPAFLGTWPGVIAWGIGIGLTFGIYFAIDLKLASLVLPSEETAGRDIGIIGVAGSAPNVLAPAIAAAMIELAGYQAIFLCGALLAVLGGLAAFPIKVRSPARAVAARPGGTPAVG